MANIYISECSIKQTKTCDGNKPESYQLIIFTFYEYLRSVFSNALRSLEMCSLAVGQIQCYCPVSRWMSTDETFFYYLDLVLFSLWSRPHYLNSNQYSMKKAAAQYKAERRLYKHTLRHSDSP